ncbi:four helix bundle protein [Thalassolituus hydrocarboniclasticus]|nr:four helix bundle protein [Thalassolituus hydrocarboniclasticus]
MMPRKYRQLVVWQKAMLLVTDIYNVSSDFPGNEQFGLSSQIRRAAVSVPSNIAEGSARGSDKEFTRFLYISRGSLMEVETQLMIAENLGYCPNGCDELYESVEQIFAMLNKLITVLKTQQ